MDRTRARQLDRWMLVAVVLVAAAGAAVAVTRPALLGTWEDDGIYVTTAKALAGGQGYRHLELPGEPWQTKYPPFYPLVLSLLWRVWPTFPDNLVALRVANGVFAVGASALGYVLIRRVWAVPPFVTGVAVILAALNPAWLESIGTTMSEAFYTLLAFAALTLLPSVVDGPRTERRPRRFLGRAALGSVLAAAAYLTRTIGVSVCVALIAGWLVRRRPRAAIIVLALGLLAAGGWEAWRHAATQRNAAIPATEWFRYDLEYGFGQAHGLREQARVLYYKAAEVPFHVFVLLGHPPQPWIDDLLADGPSVLLCGATILTALFVLVGLVTTWRPRQPELHTYLVLYLGAVCAWPFSCERFLVPVLPLVLTIFLVGMARGLSGVATGVGRFVNLVVAMTERGAGAVVSKSAVEGGTGAARRNVSRESEPLWLEATPLVSRAAGPTRRTTGESAWPHAVAGGLALLLLVHLVDVDIRMTWHIGRREVEAQRTALAQELAATTPPTAILAGRHNAYYHLMTGRKVVPFAAGLRPAQFWYPPDRRLLQFGRGMTPTQQTAERRMFEEQTMPYYRAAGVTHAFTAIGTADEFGRFLERRPSTFHPLESNGE